MAKIELNLHILSPSISGNKEQRVINRRLPPASHLDAAGAARSGRRASSEVKGQRESPASERWEVIGVGLGSAKVTLGGPDMHCCFQPFLLLSVRLSVWLAADTSHYLLMAFPGSS